MCLCIITWCTSSGQGIRTHNISMGYTFTPYRVSNFDFQELKTQPETYKQPRYYFGTLKYQFDFAKNSIGLGPRLFLTNKYEKSFGAELSYSRHLKRTETINYSIGSSIFYDYYSSLFPYFSNSATIPNLGIKENNYALVFTAGAGSKLTKKLTLNLNVGIGGSSQGSRLIYPLFPKSNTEIYRKSLFSTVNVLGYSSLSILYRFKTSE